MIFKNIRIRGVSACVPKAIVNNLHDHQFVSYEEREKTVKLTGIEEYRKASYEQTTSDLCEAASLELFKELDINPSSIDGIILVTMTPDYVAPSSACVLQDKLKLPVTTVAFDVNLGCSGYVYGLYIASSLIQGGSLKRVLLLAGDTQTKIYHNEDKNVVFLLGDAGTATIIEYASSASEIKMKFMTDGSRKDNLIIPAGGCRLPSTEETREIKKQVDGGIRSAEHLYLNGMGVFNFSITDVVNTIKEFIEKENINVNEIDYLLLHQANKFMTDKIAKKLAIPPDKVPYSLFKYGNTSSASIPLTMAHCFSQLNDKKAKHCLLSGFGVGLSWGVVDIMLEDVCYPEVIEI
jgi:3-oxoacyl-[acyl-carrier-protein] synthase-3